MANKENASYAKTEEMLMPYLKFLIKCFKIALTLAASLELEVDLLSIFDSLKRADGYREILSLKALSFAAST